MKKIFFVFLFYLLGIHSIQAQDTIAYDKNPVLTKKFYVYVGAFAPLRQVKFAFSGSVPTKYKETVDLDQTLQLEGIQVTLNVNFDWRFSKNWGLNADYFSLRSRNTVVLDRDIIWDEYTLKKGSTIEGGYGISVAKVGFGRILSRGDKHELEALLGVYILGANGYISGLAYIGEEEVYLEKSPIAVTLPLPTIGLSYIYAPSKKFSLFARADWFGITIGNINGSLWSLSPGMQYQFSKVIGGRLSYKYLSLFGNVDQLNWNGSFDMQFQGPSLGLTASF